MNIEQNSTYRELTDEECTLVQGGYLGDTPLIYLALLRDFDPTSKAEHAEKPGSN